MNRILRRMSQHATHNVSELCSVIAFLILIETTVDDTDATDACEVDCSGRRDELRVCMRHVCLSSVDWDDCDVWRSGMPIDCDVDARLMPLGAFISNWDACVSPSSETLKSSHNFFVVSSNVTRLRNSSIVHRSSISNCVAASMALWRFYRNQRLWKSLL